VPAVNAATGRCCQQGRHRLASYDTSLVVSGGVDCGRRWRNVCDKKPQRYAKDNRTAHLTAYSDKSVAYVTNSKRLYSTFCTTVEANYWQTRSIARPLCDSRATCYCVTLCIARTMPSQDVRPFVCLSVCLSHAGILLIQLNISETVSSHQTVWQYSDGNPQQGVECKGYEKIAIFDQYLALSLKWYKIKP